MAEPEDGWTQLIAVWPKYSHEASTNEYVLQIAKLVATVKSKDNLPAWDIFASDYPSFSSFFRRVLSLSLDTSLAAPIRTDLLAFLLSAFQSLDNGFVRKECAPLVSIAIWHNLASDAARERKFEKQKSNGKAWRAAAKRFDTADEEAQARFRFERSWLYTLVLDFVRRLNGAKKEDLSYCERFLEFLTDIESQLPTRRYANTLLKDLNLLALIRISTMFNDPNAGLLRDNFVLFRHYLNFPIDDSTGTQYSFEQAVEKHNEDLARLQRTALKHFKSKLTLLALSNHAAVEDREELKGHLDTLTNAELEELCTLLGFRATYPAASGFQVTRELLTEILLSAHERRKVFQQAVRDLNTQPTEQDLYDTSLVRNETYDGSRSLALPKLNLQYLSVGDFLWRSFILYRCEQFFEIRRYLEDVIARLQPEESGSDGSVRFTGFSRMALPITKPAILEAAPAKVGQDRPAYVRAEITLNVSRLADSVKRDWDSLRPDDVVYLLCLIPGQDSRKLTNGHSVQQDSPNLALHSLRTAEVIQVLDESGRQIRDIADLSNGYGHRQRIRRLMVNLDSGAFKADSETKEKGVPDVYESINVIVRRDQRENNFKKILETTQSLALSDVSMPSWLQEVFLGIGDPTSASYTRLPTRLKAIDFQDTFLDWDHVVDSFPDKVCACRPRIWAISNANNDLENPARKWRV